MSIQTPLPPSERASGYVFKNAESLELYERLERVVGLGAAQMFKDACVLLDPQEASNLSHVSYLAGHSLRELDSSIFGIIDPFVEKEKDRAKRIDASLTLLGCADERLGKQLKAINLHSIAHRDGLSVSGGVPAELRDQLYGQIKAYAEFLRLCEAKFPIWHKRADELLLKQHCPKKFKSEFPQNIPLMQYLFSKLNKPEWFAGLKAQGFFDYNPVGRFGAWPQIHYLLNIADKLPQEVLEVMLLAKTDNPWLLHDFCNAAMKMPREQAEQWAEHLAGRIPSDPANAVSSFMFNLPDFIQHLIGLKSHRAFALTSVALDILETREDDSEKFSTRSDRYHYQELLKEVIPPLADLNALTTANLLADKLDLAVRYSNWKKMLNGRDGSTDFWLPAVEDHPQNQTFYLEGSIGIALRKVLESDLKAVGGLSGWLQWLKDRNGLVYNRILIHLVRLYGSSEQLNEWLLNKDLFNSRVVLHEYLLLLQQGFWLLESDAQELLLEWIDAFPENEEITEEHREWNRQWQQYRRLAFIQDALSPEWKDRYEKLKKEVGDDKEENLDRLSFDRWTECESVEDQPPIPAEELQRMTVEELVRYLLGDIDTDEWTGKTERGLEIGLEAAVQAAPVKFVGSLDLLKNPRIEPIYIRGISKGLIGVHNGAVSDGVILEWIKWCMGISHRNGDAKGKPYTRGHEDNKKLLLGYLDRRMKQDADPLLSLDQRSAVFEIIEEAMSDPNPDTRDAWGDVHTQAINSVRGRGIITAMNYGLWVKRGVDPESMQGFSCLPELRELLEAHLDVVKEPSPAIRSCYGLYIPQLCWIDSGWVSVNLTKILPDDPRFFDAAWDTYLLYGRCYKDYFDVLRPVYERAVMSKEIERCEKDHPNSKVSDANMRLCSHLVLFYDWQQIELNEESMLCRFMRKAAPEYKAEVLNFIGRVLSDEKNLTEEVVVRYVEFHEWWSRELAVEFPKGWKSFVSWFLSPYLDHAWKIENLVKASVHTAFSYQSKEALSVLATSYFDDYPEQVLTVIENYIGHQLKRDQRWELELKNALPDILRRGHHHDKEDIRGKADELLGRLVSEGFMKYREIAEE